MDIVLNSRHCELSDRFRGHVEEKLARLEKHDHRVIRVEVEVEAERNPRQADRAVRVELTAFSKGPVIRAEAAAEDKVSALDQALYEMELVGHDFFLYVDKESERPSVVYRRRGYDYGVITLEVHCATAGSGIRARRRIGKFRTAQGPAMP